MLNTRKTVVLALCGLNLYLFGAAGAEEIRILNSTGTGFTGESIRAATYSQGPINASLTSKFVTIHPTKSEGFFSSLVADEPGEISHPERSVLGTRKIFVTTDDEINSKNFAAKLSSALKGKNSAAMSIGRMNLAQPGSKITAVNVTRSPAGQLTIQSTK